MAHATLEGFDDDGYSPREMREGLEELSLFANKDHEPATTDQADGPGSGKELDLTGQGGLEVAVRGIGHYGPGRRQERYMGRRGILGGYAMLGRELPPGIYGVPSIRGSGLN